jgi:ligand-binding sensor domain-containing protein/DNA-binding CsgD family transcriptional regulator
MQYFQLQSKMRLLATTMLGLIAVVGSFLPLLGLAQHNLGMPKVVNYTRAEYKGGTQSWAITQDEYNRLYVANNEGLLVYDGASWQKFSLPNKTILRCMKHHTDGKLYVGAQNELGYFAPDKVGRLTFVSLKSKLPENEKNFADVWEVEVCKKSVFFRTNKRIFEYTNSRIIVHPTTATWLAIFVHNGELLAHDAARGILAYTNQRWQAHLAKIQLPAEFIITDVIRYQRDTSLLCTVRNGLFLLANHQLLPFRIKGAHSHNHYTALTVLSDNSLYVGTYSNGIYHVSRNGTLLENINAQYSLQNNTIRCLHADANGNIWTGLDNGISYIALNNGIKHINPAAFNNGAGYSATVFGNEIYFALSTGLQYATLPTSKELTTASHVTSVILTDQAWNITASNKGLVVGKDDGLWRIINHQASRIADDSGYWNFKPLAGGDTITAGNYTGIQFFRANAGSFTNVGSFPNFTESSRYLETDRHLMWVSHPYRGVFQLNTKTQKIKKFTSQDGLPAELDNHVFRIKGKIVFATIKGIYEYDEALDSIVVSPTYWGVFGNIPLRYLKEDQLGNIWFVQEKMLGVADYTTKQPTLYYLPELNNKMLSGFENIYAYDVQNILVGAENGFYHINYTQYLKSLHAFKVYLKSLKAVGNQGSVFGGGFGSSSSLINQIAYEFNSLHFSFASSILDNPVEYSYYLEGFDKEWYNWTTKNEKEYTNLPEGTYTFRLKARNSPSYESAEYTFTFSISPPWHRTWWAYVIYTALISALLYGVYKLLEKQQQRKQHESHLAELKRFEDQQKQLRYEHQIALEKKAKELIQLQNEKLESEIEHKNAELTSMAMNLVQKKEFIYKISEELNKLNSSEKSTIDRLELKKILRSLTSDEKLDKDWEQFSVHFNSVHSDFLLHLKDAYPNLNAHDLKLCAYLRMNLSSKEMARLMSISVRGVEISRYRLRKKLELAPKEDLFQFLINIELSQKVKDA